MTAKRGQSAAEARDRVVDRNSVGAASTVETNARGVVEALKALRRSVAVVPGLTGAQAVVLGDGGEWPASMAAQTVLAVLPPIYPEWLGDSAFAEVHGVRYPYVIGEMARGIATPRMVIEGVRAGVMAFYGSAGLSLPEIERGITAVQSELGTHARGWGANLIHSPQEPGLELDTIRLFLKLGVRCVSASAFMKLQPAVVLFAAKGLRREHDGRIQRTGRILAKVSRAEVARQFLAPAPADMLRALAAEGMISADEASLAAQIPVAEDITAEADSGGHTDNRPLTVLLPALLQLRDELAAQHGYQTAPRVGAAGGLGTPAALAAAFAAGAAYVVTGSINQSAMESGLSADARALLGRADSTDVAMAPAADMFEMGVKVQVLKRGTLFAQRGQKLADFYRRYDSFAEAPRDELADIERAVLGRAADDIWSDVQAHFARTDPSQIERAERDGKHRMALVFRWYLFMGAQWAREGVVERRADYQIWCGPAMGAFNVWTRGTFLEPVEQRSVSQIALNLLEGAATVTRAGQMRSCGIALPSSAFDFRPRPLK